MTQPVDRARVFGEVGTAVERIAPGFFPRDFEAEHEARYSWSSRFVSGRVVLDVACGTGYGARLLRKGGAREVFSVDISRDALGFGRARYALSAACANALALPLQSAGCDAVVSLETIEHLADCRGFLHELWRVLRPGGELLLSTPNSERSGGANPYHLTEMTLEQVGDLLKECRFRLAGVWGQHWGVTQTMWHRVRGVRRILWEIERMPTVFGGIPFGWNPVYWCVRAKKS